MRNILRNDFLLQQTLPQIVQILQILHILALCVDKFADDMVTVCHLVGWSFWSIIFWIRLKLNKVASLLCQVEYMVDDLDDLIACKIGLRQLWEYL